MERSSRAAVARVAVNRSGLFSGTSYRQTLRCEPSRGRAVAVVSRTPSARPLANIDYGDEREYSAVAFDAAKSEIGK